MYHPAAAFPGARSALRPRKSPTARREGEQTRLSLGKGLSPLLPRKEARGCAGAAGSGRSRSSQGGGGAGDTGPLKFSLVSGPGRGLLFPLSRTRLCFHF